MQNFGTESRQRGLLWVSHGLKCNPGRVEARRWRCVCVCTRERVSVCEAVSL